MEEFPSEDELNVAAALLLLSHTPPPLPSSCVKLSSKETSFEATPCNSSLTTENSHCIKLMHTASSPSRIMQLKVARRARSKVIYMSASDRKPSVSSWSKPPVAKTAADSRSIRTSEGSCLSTGGTSEISSGRKSRKRGGSTHIRRSAEAIIGMLSRGGCASEVRIRQLLGDSPDTSKALRMLLRMDVVKRSGHGGRADPYIYSVHGDTVCDPIYSSYMHLLLSFKVSLS